MTLPMPTDPVSAKAIQDAIDEIEHPGMPITHHAGWLICNETFFQEGKSWKFVWLAANKLTGRIVRFHSYNDEPEISYETAADELAELLVEELS
jgi:hypothetical protein